MSLRLGALIAAVLQCSACSLGDEPSRLHTDVPPPVPSGTVAVEPRTQLLPTYPCTRCHNADRPPNPTERTLTQFHTQKVLDHGKQSGWCYRCHTPGNLDRLHIADGTLVSFDEAYELCGSCHGDKLRDWKAGIHGLTTGFWLGSRTRRSCPACHDPHKPKFPLMTPEHPPQLPRTVKATPRAVTEEESHGESH